MSRHAGVLLPLFSIASSSSWGVGEIPDLPVFGRWLAAAGFDRVMILPIGTMQAGESSPYSAMSTMAIDPIYVAVGDIEDVDRVTSRGVRETAAALAAVRANPRVQYVEIRELKRRALEAAFDRFVDTERRDRTDRARDFEAFVAEESWWLLDYARFQAIAAAVGSPSWRGWAPPLRDREPAALDHVDRDLSRAIEREQYAQWIAARQWQSARAALRAEGIGIIGDLPFGLGVDSPEVWASVEEFDLDVSVGVPPDAFSATGQDWRLPMYRWDVIGGRDFEYLRRRGRRMAALYDGFRVDHLVGYYRTFGRPPTGDPFFAPADESAQRVQGERIVHVLREGGAAVLAEDLGTVPDFVRESMARIGLPGCKVLRWERAWHAEGQPFLDPANFPPASMTVTGTHDLEPLASWWESASADERREASRIPALASHGTNAGEPWSDALRDRWLEAAYGAGSDDLFLPVQDIFGWRDRLNTPGTITDANWTWKLPWPVDEWVEVAQAIERAGFCRGLAVRTARASNLPAG